MTTITESARFQEILKTEMLSIQQFVEILASEQSNLTLGKTNDLAEFAEQKGKLAAKLNELAESRNQLLTKSGFTSDKSGIEAWCRKYPNAQDLGILWNSILMLAAEARELNRLNGDLIKIHMQHNSKALEILMGSNDTLRLYGPDGQSSAIGNGRINDAA